MAYDLHGSWEGTTGHNSPLYPRQGESGAAAELNVVSGRSEAGPARPAGRGVPVCWVSFLGCPLRLWGGLTPVQHPGWYETQQTRVRGSGGRRRAGRVLSSRFQDGSRFLHAHARSHSRTRMLTLTQAHWAGRQGLGPRIRAVREGPPHESPSALHPVLLGLRLAGEVTFPTVHRSDIELTGALSQALRKRQSDES